MKITLLIFTLATMTTNFAFANANPMVTSGGISSIAPVKQLSKCIARVKFKDGTTSKERICNPTIDQLEELAVDGAVSIELKDIPNFEQNDFSPIGDGSGGGDSTGGGMKLGGGNDPE